MNTGLKKSTNDFEKKFFKLMNHAVFGKTMKNMRKHMNNIVFGKTMENMRNHRDIKLAITERRRNCLVSEPNYHTTNFFTEYLLAIEMKKR